MGEQAQLRQAALAPIPTLLLRDYWTPHYKICYNTIIHSNEGVHHEQKKQIQRNQNQAKNISHIWQRKQIHTNRYLRNCCYFCNNIVCNVVTQKWLYDFLTYRNAWHHGGDPIPHPFNQAL